MPVIDVIAQWGPRPNPIRASSVEAITSILQRFDIEKCILSATEGIRHDFVRGNERLAEAIDGEERLFGYATVNPNYVEASIGELRKYLYKEDFLGVVMHTSTLGIEIDAPEVKDCLNACRRYDKPILLYCYGDGEVRKLVAILEEFESLNFILTHMGGDAWENGMEVASDHFNLFLGPCTFHAARDHIKKAVEKIGDRRLVFGSDLTLINPAFVAGMVRDADLTVQQKERIFYRNAKELFGL